MIRREYSFGLFSLLVIGMLWGCKKEEPVPPPPPPSKPAAVKQQQMSSAKGAAVVPPFDFTTRRDPFKPAIVEVKIDDKRAKLKGALPIQQFDLGQFKVTGIIVGLRENFAQVVDPTGKAYTLKKGMMIGTNNGQVVAITPAYIEVAERVADDFGKVKTRTERLVIPKKN